MYLFYILAWLCASCCLLGLKVQILQCHKVAVLAVFLNWLEMRGCGNLTEKPSVRLSARRLIHLESGRWGIGCRKSPSWRGAARMVFSFPSRSWNFEGRSFQTGELMQGLSTGPRWLRNVVTFDCFPALRVLRLSHKLWSMIPSQPAKKMSWRKGGKSPICTRQPVISQIITNSICFPHLTAVCWAHLWG